MSSKCLDYKVINSSDPLALAKFVHELTLKGYEPMPLQCTRQWGNMVVTMGLFEKDEAKVEDTETLSKGENDESTKESTGDKPSVEATNTIDSGTGDGEAEQPKAEEKPKPKPRAKSSGAGSKNSKPTESDDK